MSKLRILMFALFAASTSLLYCQSYDLWQPVTFTWEGANTGNKAKWMADDIANQYTVQGNSIKVTLLDPLGLNTTTNNQSEFNDFTKTNTFYGRGNLALQIKSQQSGQAVCLEFEFSHPSILNKFNVFDIDMLQSGTNPLSTYQDSVHFAAFDMNGEVPLILSYLSPSPVFTIQGQSVKANYMSGVNGDIAHSNPAGGVLVSSAAPISKFVLCYANGSEDDGTSNSHAIKILGFEYQEVLGRIEGTVYDINTQLPLSGSIIKLVDFETEQQVYNKLGETMEVTTNMDGHYIFPSLPLGKYKILQTDPIGYDSHSDIDGENDNLIVKEININQPISLANDFFEVLGAPLPVKLSSVDLTNLIDDKYRLTWKAEQEINCNYYEVSISQNGKEYVTLDQVKAKNTTLTSYTYDFANHFKSNAYVRLSQSDYDGTKTILSIKPIKFNSNNEAIQFHPNPFTEGGNITFGTNNESFINYRIYNAQGKIMQASDIPTGFTHYALNFTDFSEGLYILELQGVDTSKSIKIFKR